MSRDCIEKNRSGWRRAGVWLLQVCALVLMVLLALPGRAEERAIKSRVAPVYPELAKRMKIGGMVKLEVNVDAGGKVVDVKAISGNHMLATAAEDAVRKWRFEPGTSQTTVVVDVNFALGN